MKSGQKIGTAALLAALILSPYHTAAAEQAVSAEDDSLTITSVEERRILVTLKEERSRLSQWEKKLAEQEMSLKTLEGEVDKKLNELTALKAELEVLLGQKGDEEANNIQELGKMYEKMDPVKAAQLLATLDDKAAIAVLSAMKKKAAANILNNLEQKKAERLSATFSRLDQE